MARRVSVMAALALAAGLALAAPATRAATGWDQTKNLKDAAERLGGLHKKGGAEGVLKFLDACYRTHTLSSSYSAAVEGCIAQDVMYARVLAAVYSRIPPKARAERTLPTAEQINAAMQQRVVTVLRQYSVPAAEVDALQKAIDRHAMPIILKAVFPNAAVDAGKAE